MSYTVCSKSDVIRITNRGFGGLKYPWLDKNIAIGEGFFVARTQEDLDLDKGRPSIPTSMIYKESGIKHITYKAERKGEVGYFAERIK